MIRSDKPIYSPKEDLLGRSSFAEDIAKSILNYPNSDSLSIGLYGAWGSGKTSILNLLTDYLVEKKNEILIIKFNPWHFSNQENLLLQFFSVLGENLTKREESGQKDLGKNIKKYAKLFKPFKYTPTLTFIGEAATAIEQLGEGIVSVHEKEDEDIFQLREKIEVSLGELNKKIVIIIDDIDRLPNEDIRQIFKLIKAVGDFTNTIYILSFDKKVVLRAIEKIQEGNGEHYLEKIIQVPLEVPPIPDDKLQEFLFSNLNILLGDICEEDFDKTYWGNIYYSGFKQFFQSLRDVIRYINAISFDFHAVKNEVNIVDYFAIKALQVFVPEAFHYIRNHKDRFTGINEGRQQGQNQDNLFYDKLIEFSRNYLNEEKAKEFFQRLFPRLQGVYGNMGFSHEFIGIWRRQAKVCSKDVFDNYFRLSNGSNQISFVEIKRILELTSDAQEFEESILGLIESNKIGEFLERFEDYTSA